MLHQGKAIAANTQSTAETARHRAPRGRTREYVASNASTTSFQASPELWSTLDSLSTKMGQRLAAVAYVTNDAVLRLGANDVLICDASPACIRAGQTSAKILDKLRQRGAEVYSYPGLHAKVLVVGDTLIVGSANHSASSRDLMEAGVHTTDRGLVAEAIAFIRALQKDRVNCDPLGPDELARLLAIKVERRGQLPRMRKPKTRVFPSRTRIRGGWVAA